MQQSLPSATTWSVVTVAGGAVLGWLVLTSPGGSVDPAVLVLGLLGLAHTLDAGPLRLMNVLLARRRLHTDPERYLATAAAEIRLPHWLGRQPSRAALPMVICLVGLSILGNADPLTAQQAYAVSRPAVIDHGQWYRLITCAGVHAGLAHVLINALAGGILASLLERLSHWGLVCITLLLSVVGGSLATISVNPATPSVGASGGILGLGGAVLGLCLRRRELRQAGLTGNLIRWVVIVAVIGALGIGVIDNAAHAGGLLTGVVVGALAAPAHADQWPAQRSPIITVAGPLACGLLLAVVVWLGLMLNAG